MKTIVPLEEGKYYHIYNRGNNKDQIFFQDSDFQSFLNKYFRYCHHVFETFAYCLMTNHFHLLVRVREREEQRKVFQIFSDPKKAIQNPSKHLSNLFSSHAQSVNKREGRTGSLFQKNFKRREIDSNEYFLKSFIYIHQNPIKHRLVTDFCEYKWSSFQYYYSKRMPCFPLNMLHSILLFGNIENLTFPKS